MTKKNRKAKKDNQADNESAEVKPELTETASAEGEAGASNPNLENADKELSADDLLDDVRRSLIEDEADDGKKSSWWNRIGKGKYKDQDEEVLPAVESTAIVDEKPQGDTAYLEQIDELIDLLEPEVEDIQTPVTEPQVLPSVEPIEPEVVVDVAELKKRVFSPGEAGAEREMSEVRNIALEGGEDVFVEVEAKTADPLDESFKAFKNSLRPYRRVIDFALAFMGLAVAVVVLFGMYTVYQRSRPPEPAKEPSNLPYPTMLILPGGLNFNLGKGVLNKDEAWNPRGPEWLEGTEISRWVAIPWSRQLEAVVRTLTQKDEIELVMNNSDKLKYNVSSIRELTLAEMGELDQNSPSLVLVLAKQDSDKRWVVIALPR